MRKIKRFLAGLVVMANSAIIASAQTLSQVEQGLESVKVEVIRIVNVVFIIAIIVALVVAAINVIGERESSKKSVITFFVVLILYGLFRVLFI